MGPVSQRRAERSPVTPQHRFRVLLIEDVPDDVTLIQHALALEHFTAFECVHASRLHAGLEVLARGGIDLILLDLTLPDSEGLATLVTLRARAPRLPIVVLTTSDDEGLDLQALQQGAHDYLVKSSLEAYPNLLARSIRYAIERKRAELLKDEFVNMVSHELRTPLTTMREFTSILSDGIAGPLTKDQQEFLGIIRSNLDRLGRMIDSLLDVAKMEAGHLTLAKGLVDIEALLDHVIKSLRPLADNKGIELALQLPASRPDILADADKLTQIFVNLIGNAIKFTPAPGRVTVTLAEHPHDVQFTVADTGLGIAPDDLPKLFEKFQQLHPPQAGEQQQGTGLGLAISKRLVELHGGRIWATSAEGRGSIFAFTLPRYNPEELFHEYFRARIEQARRAQTSFSIVLVSVAEAEILRARYGQEETAQLIRKVEALLEATVRRRAGDFVVRWRQGDLVVVVAEASQEGVRAMAERLHQTLTQHPFQACGAAVALQFHFATASFPEDGTTEQELLECAQRQLRPGPGTLARILVVDDEPKIRLLLKEILELRHYEVVTAVSGPEALALLQHHPVDLILLDLMLPVMGGYEVYHLLKENPATAQVPVIIVTAQQERKDRELGIEGPTYNYVPKPIDVNVLLAKVSEALQRKPQ